MRTWTEQEIRIKQALAIYRGLPDNERAERLQIARTNRTHPDADVRAMADTLVRLFDRAEAEIQADKKSRTELEARVRLLENLSPGYPDTRTDAEVKRGTFGALLIFAGVGGVIYACYEFGVMTVLGGAAVIAAIRFLFSSKSGNTETDYAPATRPTAQAQTQTIIFNVSQNGDVNFSRQ